MRFDLHPFGNGSPPSDEKGPVSSGVIGMMVQPIDHYFPGFPERLQVTSITIGGLGGRAWVRIEPFGDLDTEGAVMYR